MQRGNRKTVTGNGSGNPQILPGPDTGAWPEADRRGLLQYDENSIKQWAIKEGHIMFLALDRAGFDAWAKVQIKAKKLPAPLAESGAAVNEIETATATISKEI